MSTNEDSQPGHRRNGNGVTPPNADDSTIIAVGLSVQAWGAALAEHGRVRRKLARPDRAASLADLVRVARGFAGDLDSLIVGLSAEVRRNL